MSTDFTKGVGADGSVVVNQVNFPDGGTMPYKKFIMVSTTDLNTLTEEGYYSSDNSSTNGAVNSPFSDNVVSPDWRCHVINFKNVGGGISVHQIFYDSLGQVFSRFRNTANQWLAWSSAYNAHGNTLQDVDFSGVSPLADPNTATLVEVATLLNSVIGKLKNPPI